MVIADSAAIKKHFIRYSLGWIVPRQRYVSVFVPRRCAVSLKGMIAANRLSEVVAVNPLYRVAKQRTRHRVTNREAELGARQARLKSELGAASEQRPLPFHVFV
jgi:hypothetical protein